ncbi:uncharacterized protein ASPGLDRAFT_1302920 [Aspergillus glaucus CBS 516.65]|uniref:Uncharacterized protein n=1 Tax=Aspergillus glaucus CBS 516.65 TaxID=1160497 RepID=A0A1L9VQ49_ASPGL|nr:hypothetical protein ASPGLDRAFT_1302920 [Aspergillus glaucus CBS 516.65]OJJ86010.1 hypothetical protein ASPGLDRAFT_1302920 [Aspergillus glaucus CBS 516.65]
MSRASFIRLLQSALSFVYDFHFDYIHTLNTLGQSINNGIARAHTPVRPWKRDQHSMCQCVSPFLFFCSFAHPGIRIWLVAWGSFITFINRMGGLVFFILNRLPQFVAYW